MINTHPHHIGKAVVLLSGGIDSSTTLAIARERGFELYALTVFYGQRHKAELQAAQAVAKLIGVARHEIINLNLSQFGGSALTDNIEVPKDQSFDSRQDQIPITYVPARNTVLLSIALAWAEAIGARHLFIGANAVDYSGYPDCRPEFITAFERLANLATKAGVEGAGFHIEAPLMHLSKAKIIQRGEQLNLDYSLTHSCYDPTPEGLACGACDSCLIRRQGFLEANVPDPTRYVK